MSNDEVWHFARGQECLGPFSKDQLQKIYEAGQLKPETLVWKEGMPDWAPAKSVPELDIPPRTASPAASTLAAPGAAPKPSGKLKLKDPAPAPVSKAIAPIEMPEPLPPAPAPKAPEPDPVKAELSATNGGELPDKREKVERPSLIRRIFSKIFSSRVMAPLFLIAAGVIIFLNQGNFPNTYWFSYLAYGFAVYGLLSLVGVHGLDTLFHFLAFFFVFPAIGLFWPVIMNEVSWKAVPTANWVFLFISLLYCYTTRIGLRIYTSVFTSRLAAITGLMTLALIYTISSQLITPTGWKSLVAQRNRPRLPARLAKTLGKPEWGTGAGWIKFTGPSASEHQIESAIVKPANQTELRLTLKTMDDLLLIVKINAKVEDLNTEKFLKQPWPVFFSKEAANEAEVLVPTWNLANGAKAEISSANITINEIKGGTWSGTILLSLQGDNPPIVGTFATEVTTLTE